jgi:hypothetical protein
MIIIKPPFFLLLVALGVSFLSIYNTYRLFSQPHKIKKESLTWISKVPKWYPLRAQMIKSSKSVNSPVQLVFLIFLTSIVLITTIFLFVAWFIGQ